jgi:3-oxoacyl-[acyl-carrier-protein] synthase-1
VSQAGIEIAGWGACTPLGLDATHTGFVYRAGLTRVRDTLFFDPFGDPVRMSVLDTLPQDCSGGDRLAALAAPAAREAAERADARDCRLGMLLTVDAGLGPSGGDELLARVGAAVSEVQPVAHAQWMEGGATAGASALALAARWLDSLDLVLVGGVHSDYDWARLQPALAAARIIDAENVEGFIPGEGAGFVALRRAGAGADAAARVASWAHAVGDSTVDSLAPQVEAFSRALDAATSWTRGRRTNAWYVDLTHEQARVRELEILFARFGDLVGEHTVLHMPLRDFGNLGAATQPLFWVMAVEAWSRGYADDSLAICLAGSDDGSRSAVLLQAGEGAWAARS